MISPEWAIWGCLVVLPIVVGFLGTLIEKYNRAQRVKEERRAALAYRFGSDMRRRSGPSR